MNKNQKPTSIASVIFWWVIAIGAALFDFLVLLPADNLDWWQIAITIFLIGSAIHTTLKYRKEQAERIQG